MANRNSQSNHTPPPSTTKQTISRILLAVMLAANIYLVYRIYSNFTTISSYDAGISQRSGVGQLENFWTKYTGGAKKFETTYEDRLNAEADNNISGIVLGVLDVVVIGALYVLNKKPEVPKVELSVEERRELRLERKRRNSTR